MPIYEYKCATCGGVFEVRQKFADEPLTVHENCGGAVHRLISAPALQFKGTGWYVTDYAKGNGGASSRPPSHAHSHSESKSESKSETKSESKPESKSSNGSSTTSTSSSSDKK